MTLDDLPPAFRSLAGELEQDGYRLVQDERSESFGNRLIQFDKGESSVRFVRDRGDWRSDIRLSDRWWDPELLVAADEEREAEAIPGPDEDAERTRTALRIIGAADAGRLNELRSAADARGTRRAKRFFG